MKFFKKATLFVFAFVSANLQVSAQESKALDNELLKLCFGSSKHGSGDFGGISVATEYTQYFRKRLSWSASIGATIHDDERELLYQVGGVEKDGSIRQVIAGVQALAGLGYSPVLTNRHEIKVSLSALLRYQSRSSSGYGIYYPIVTSLPFPVIAIDNNGPARTFTLGTSLSAGYNYTLDKGVMLGILGAFQADLEGDVLPHLSLSVGKRF